ncbi:hypothetical protein C2G38_2143989 [Gigaspora rosea]|uniref:Transmembrane protein n=1 Tax=Gigaspora rosea TaxID=44941 RepID=A0A397UYA2_9GLOM|nr:hypothetical protein C2G38_2143989 [Gigaspora rosea]
MVVLSGDRPNSVNVRFRVSLYSLSSVGCQIGFSGSLLLSCSVFNKLSTVSSWNGYLRLGFLSLFKFYTGYLFILGIRLLVIEVFDNTLGRLGNTLLSIVLHVVIVVCYVLGVTCVIGKCFGCGALYTLFGALADLSSDFPG